MESLRDDLIARIAELDAEIEQVLGEALLGGLGIGTQPVMAQLRAALAGS